MPSDISIVIYNVWLYSRLRHVVRWKWFKIHKPLPWDYYLSEISDTEQSSHKTCTDTWSSSLLLCGRSHNGVSSERINLKIIHRRVCIPVLLSVEQSSIKRLLSDRTWTATNTKHCTRTTIPVSHINVLTRRRGIIKARIWGISSVFRSYVLRKRNSQTKFRRCTVFVKSITWSNARSVAMLSLKIAFVTDFHDKGNSVRRDC